jgi:hypothetical protein
LRGGRCRGNLRLLGGCLLSKGLLHQERDERSRILGVFRRGRHGDDFRVWVVSLLLLLFGLLPLLRFFSRTFRRGFRTMLHKMTILMAYFAFERKLFIINLLQVVLFIEIEINSL